MSRLKEKVYNNWHLMRIVRLAIGIGMIILAIQTKDWAAGLFGGFFLFQAVTDTGCCGTQGCAAPRRNGRAKAPQQLTDVDYEEIK
jgi:hypothetical protein